MNHVNEYEDIDREASLWATAALESRELPNGFTVQELAWKVWYPLPLSKKDLTDLARLCRKWNVKTNVDNSPLWKKALESVGVGFEMDPMRAAQQEREDKFDEKMDRQREEDNR